MFDQLVINSFWLEIVQIEREKRPIDLVPFTLSNVEGKISLEYLLQLVGLDAVNR